MEEPAKVISFAKCSYCDKLTFIDFLDEAMLCEYCREQGRTQPSRMKRHDAAKRGRLYKIAVGDDE